ncbi:hypothetical protein ACSLVQ_29775, partial [Klebsiella pneumoniae]|uniref:hypothetical protein n=1 Tax=Klebsiella pneumoniae TaxID=573 RepID=UPI003EDFD6FF
RAALSLTAARHADARRRLDLLAAEGLAPLDEAPDFAPLINAASGSTEPPPPPEPAAKVSPLYRLVTYRVSGLISSIGINMA